MSELRHRNLDATCSHLCVISEKEQVEAEYNGPLELRGEAGGLAEMLVKGYKSPVL